MLITVYNAYTSISSFSGNDCNNRQYGSGYMLKGYLKTFAHLFMFKTDAKLLHHHLLPNLFKLAFPFTSFSILLLILNMHMRLYGIFRI